MLKFAIFDLDGTLLNSTPMWEQLGARYLSNLGKTAEPDLAQKLNALSLEEGARYLRSRYELSFSAEEIHRHLTRMTEDYYTTEVRLKDDAAKLLALLRARCVHMSIATAGSERLAWAALSRLGAADFFGGIASCENYGSKRSPDVYLAAADLIYALPEETAVFEDSLFAVQTAHRAGFTTVAVKDVSESNQTALKNTADFYAESLGEVVEMLGEIFKK